MSKPTVTNHCWSTNKLYLDTQIKSMSSRCCVIVDHGFILPTTHCTSARMWFRPTFQYLKSCAPCIAWRMDTSHLSHLWCLTTRNLAMSVGGNLLRVIPGADFNNRRTLIKPMCIASLSIVDSLPHKQAGAHVGSTVVLCDVIHTMGFVAQILWYSLSLWLEKYSEHAQRGCPYSSADNKTLLGTKSDTPFFLITWLKLERLKPQQPATVDLECAAVQPALIQDDWTDNLTWPALPQPPAGPAWLQD